MAKLLCMYGGRYPKLSFLDPRVKASIEKYAPEAGLECEWVDTTDNLQLYADKMDEYWNGEEDLIIVEQDKEVNPECFPTFLSCPAPWCGYTFWQNPTPHTGLVLGGFGVTKFSAEVQTWFPVSAFRGESQINIDRRFYDCLMGHGHGCHLHGHVLHHHTYEPRPQKVIDFVRRTRGARLAAPALAPDVDDPRVLPGSYFLEE